MSLIETFEMHRPLLFATAYRMLGSVTEAEDIVQDTYLRFQAARDIRSPRAYLCTIVTRLCLDALSAARTTRERYLGPWLPKRLLTDGADLPLETAVQRESISRALLILLEQLTPPERAVFVLHEVFEYTYPDIAAMLGLSAVNCRQLFHRAQQHLAVKRVRFTPAPEAHQHMVDQFLAALEQGALPAFTALLVDDVTSWSDGSRASSADCRPVYRTQQVARLVIGGAQTFPLGAWNVPKSMDSQFSSCGSAIG